MARVRGVDPVGNQEQSTTNKQVNNSQITEKPIQPVIPVQEPSVKKEPTPKVQAEQVPEKSPKEFTKVELQEPQPSKWVERLKRFGALAATFGLIAIGRSTHYPKTMSFYKAERDLAVGALKYALGKDPPEDERQSSLTQEEAKVVKQVAQKYDLGKTNTQNKNNNEGRDR